MKLKLMGCLFVGLAFTLTLAISGQRVKPIELPRISIAPLGRAAQVPDTPLADSGGSGLVNVIGALAIPGGLGANGNDLLWVDQPRGRLYLTDRTNTGVDIFDASNGVFVDRVPGFVGLTGVGGLRGGPNGLLVQPDDNILWAADGNMLMQVADLNVNPPRITHTISIGGGAEGRADELAYDPVDRIVMVGSDRSVPPRVTFISTDTYSILGKIDFPDAGGMEQPVWDTQLHRFLQNVPASPAYVAVIDPVKRRVTKKYNIPNCTGGVNGMNLGTFQQMFLLACSNYYVMNAIDGHIVAKNFPQLTGGDQVWYNAGDNRYYTVATDTTAGLGTVISVIDAATNTWIQNVPAPGVRNIAVFQGNNHVFAAIAAPAAGVRDTTVCAQFGLVNTGCIAVFGHF